MHTVKLTINGKELSIETGRFAKLASGAVMVRCGDTMVLVTAQSAANARPNMDFLPLTCEYREKHASSGKIPGGFFRREGRPTTKEILCSRLIDRPSRPLLPKSWRFETQVIATVHSFDGEVEPDTLAMVGASAALSISDIPFAGPTASVRVGRVDGEFVINPTLEQMAASDIDVMVAGTDESIVMVEGSSKEISEEDFVAAMEYAHVWVKKLVAIQQELVDIIKPVKREVVVTDPPQELVDAIETAIASRINKQIREKSIKPERVAFRTEINELATEAATTVAEANEEAWADLDIAKLTTAVIKKIEAREMREMVLTDGVRLDGRKTDEIRPIECVIGILPRPHGSALFTRGETQALTTVTLGTKRDQQLVDGLLPTYEKRYMLHYNFPPFSTGETGRFGFTSRRETGHGDLAERALENFLPDADDFPYTIRVVSDILESNGSSSMATVCAGSLALFQAGVPMKKAVSGIAMGLILEGDRYAVLSDILGDEDFLGDMDFKVTGTDKGITACQMDIKVEGLSLEIMSKALQQARVGRFHILDKMNETISAPSEEVSAYAPRLTTIKVPVDQIGAVIGPGGETIRNIVKETGAEVNIEDDGTVTIAAVNGDHAAAAVKMIQDIVKPLEEGATYKGIVKEIREGLGAFVEIAPKKQGLLHVSQLEHHRVENVGDILTVGEELQVKLIEIQPGGKFRLSRKALMLMPDGSEPPAEEPRRQQSRGGYGDRGDRGGRGGGRDRRDDRRGGYGGDRDRRDDRGRGGDRDRRDEGRSDDRKRD